MPKIAPFETHVNRYEDWFTKYPEAYAAELRAVQPLVPKNGCGIEVGAGTGRFSVPLGISQGVEPSAQMAKTARRHNMQIVSGVAEDLPLGADQFDFVLMVTTVCFLDDISRAFQETRRILKPGGFLIVGFVDRTSPLGQLYLAHQHENVFYRDAIFYSVDEIVAAMQQTGFVDFDFRQTIFRALSEITPAEPVKAGYGEGSFVVVRAKKEIDDKNHN
jgi:SAM-dependent methyltransferase